MKNIKAIILASLICVFGSSYALAEGFSVGFTGAIADIEALVLRPKVNRVRKNNAQVTTLFDFFCVAEMNDVMGTEFLGVDYIPMSADVSNSVRRTDGETSVSGTDTTTDIKKPKRSS